MIEVSTQMRRTATILILGLGAAAVDLAVLDLSILGLAAPSRAYAQTAPSELSPPARRRPARARTRITVSPAYPYRTYSTTFPVPYKYEYPGPGSVRQCTSWLATENRLSGTVITPQMRCWWQPGR